MKQGYIIGIGIVVILILIAGGILLWQKGGETDGIFPSPPTSVVEPVEPTNPTEPVEATTPQDQVSPEILEGWKTYENEDYGFEIKYPEGWQVNFIDARKEGYDADALFSIFNIEVNAKRMQTKNLDGIQYNNGIKIFIEKFDGDIQAFIQKKYVMSPYFEYISQNQTILPNGMEAITVRYKEPSAYDAQWEIPLLYRNGFIFQFWEWPSSPSSNDDNTKERLDQILSTLRFLK